MIHITKKFDGKKKRDKNLLATFKKHSYPRKCGIDILKKLKKLSKIDLEFKNFKSPFPHMNGV
jgi:hypothetical protein